MQNDTGGINLLRVKTRFNPHLPAIEKEIRIVCLIVFSLVITAGIITSSIFLLLQKQEKDLVQTKTTLEQTIQNAKQKEGLFMSIRDRITSIGKIYEKRYPWGDAVKSILALAPPASINNISIDAEKNVSVRMKTISLDETRSMVGAVVSRLLDKTLLAPRLTTLKLDENGNVQTGLTFKLALPE